MSEKHTPGPWEVCCPRNRFDCIRIFSGNRCIAYVGGANRRTDDDANAALIAAAPDMLAALESIQAELSRAAADARETGYREGSSLPASIHVMIDRAIRKASGEENEK